MPEVHLTAQQIKGLKTAVGRLNSRNPSERDVAQRVIDSFGASKFDILVMLLEDEVACRRRRKRTMIVGIGAYFTLASLAVAVPLATGHHPNGSFFTTFSSMTGVFAGAFAVSQAQKNATRALEEFDDKRSIGWWALALEYDDRQVVSLARKKLIQLLPEMLASDRNLTTDEQRTALYRGLVKWRGAPGENAELMAAILKALEQIGDEKALPAVEKLAEGEGLARTRPELRTAAQECLPALRHRIELNHSSASLLRASAPEASSPEMLLRPADGAPVADPSVLLRATDADSTGAVPAELAELQTLRHGADAAEPGTVNVSYRN